MCPSKVTVSFFAVSRTGNRGAVSMLESAIDHITSDKYHGRVHVFTVYPKQDLTARSRLGVDLVNGTPTNLIFKLLPLCILHRVLQMLHLGLPKGIRGKAMQAILESDVCVIAGGTTFSDAQPLKVIYNVACILPALILKKKSMLYSQTMGPFKQAFNRFCAKFCLSRVDVVVPRGQGSYECVQELGIKQAIQLADSAFTLQIPADMEATIQAKYADMLAGKTVVGISINTIVQRKCEGLNIDHNGIWVRFIEYLLEKGYFVLMVPHSIRPNSQSRHNNDLPTVDEIVSRLSSKDNLHVVREHYDCKELRVVVGLADYYVASRFHSMISAICTETPVTVFGWGYQKYREVLSDFGIEEYCHDAAQLSFKALVEGFEKIVSEAHSIKTRMRTHLPEVQDSSRRNHHEVLRLAGIDDPTS